MAASLWLRLSTQIENIVTHGRCFSTGQVLLKKATNKKKLPGKAYGIKRGHGQFVHEGEILATQGGLVFYPGENVGVDRANRLYALCDGEVAVSCEALQPYPDSPLYKHISRGNVIHKKFFNIIPIPLHAKFKLVGEL